MMTLEDVVAAILARQAEAESEETKTKAAEDSRHLRDAEKEAVLCSIKRLKQDCQDGLKRQTQLLNTVINAGNELAEAIHQIDADMGGRPTLRAAEDLRDEVISRLSKFEEINQAIRFGDYSTYGYSPFEDDAADNHEDYEFDPDVAEEADAPTDDIASTLAETIREFMNGSTGSRGVVIAVPLNDLSSLDELLGAAVAAE